MCGTIGAASIDLNARPVEKPIRLYVDQVTEDGKKVDFSSGNIVFSSKAHRVNMDVKTINFVHRKMYVGYFLEGMDSSETIVKNTDSIDISYTNLAGGNDTYHYKVYDADSNQCLADLSVSFRKNYKFWEQARVKKQCYLEFLQEKEAEISELAYKDLVTGVFNRNYFEQERARIDVKKLTALVSVSINHVEYFKSKYGIFYTENILRTGVSVMKKCAPEEIKICRVSENIFYFWFTKPVQLEVYIQDIKDMFQKKEEESDVPYSFSVGAIYNNTVGKENIDELIDRCGKMRLLDEKHAEAKFIEGKMKML